MRKVAIFLSVVALLLGCNPTAKNTTQTELSTDNVTKNPVEFIPDGYKVFEEIQGDLNNDKVLDIILIVKATDKSEIVNDEDRGELDRNRRGIVIAFKKDDHYELGFKNLSCFSSENEDGGVYFPPELTFKVENGNLLFHYDHGRYGWWQYTFRYQNNDLELIGYDQTDNQGPIFDIGYSINFLTKKLKIQENLNKDASDDGAEEIKTTWKDIDIQELFKLSKIESIDGLDLSPFYLTE